MCVGGYMMLQDLSMNQEQVEVSIKMPASPREVYLPNLPIDAQRHQLTKIAQRILEERDDFKEGSPYLVSTYLGKICMEKTDRWRVVWLDRRAQVTLQQNSGGGWGESFLPNMPSRSQLVD